MGKIATRKYCNEKNGSNVYIYGSTTKCPTVKSIKNSNALTVPLKYETTPNKLVQESDVVVNTSSNGFLVIYGKYMSITTALTVDVYSTVSSLGNNSIIANVNCKIVVTFTDGTKNTAVTKNIVFNHLKSDGYTAIYKTTIEIPKKTNGIGYLSIKDIKLTPNQNYLTHTCEVIENVMPMIKSYNNMYKYDEIKFKIENYTNTSQSYKITFKPTISLTYSIEPSDLYAFKINPIIQESNISSFTNITNNYTPPKTLSYSNLSTLSYYNNGYFPKCIKIAYEITNINTNELIDKIYVLAPVSNNSGMELSSLIDDE